MIVLALDTATPAVTAGIVELGATIVTLAERTIVDARAHAERLTPNVVAALADGGKTMADLDAVVVGCGPGPFTGLRVGMATAAAYGQALGIPVHGVCTLDAIARATRGEVLVVTDARRREVYWARYRDGVRVAGPAVNAAAEVMPTVCRRWPDRRRSPRRSDFPSSDRSTRPPPNSWRPCRIGTRNHSP